MAHLEAEASADAQESYTVEEAASLFDEQDAPDEVSEPDEIVEDEVETVEESADEAEEETEAEEEAPQFIPPVSWSKEEREVFAALPPEAQQVIVDRESERDTAFQKKTTEIAEQRKALEQETEQVTQQGLEYHKRLQNILQANIPLPDNRLRDPNSEMYDPQAFNEQVARYNQHRAQMEANQRELERQQAMAKQYADFQEKQRITERDQELSTKLLPEYANPEYQKGLKDFAEAQGFNEDDFTSATSQQIIMLDMAKKWADLENSKPTVRDKVKTVPKVQKAGSKGDTKNSVAQLEDNLRKSGSVQDAARLF